MDRLLLMGAGPSACAMALELSRYEIAFQWVRGISSEKKGAHMYVLTSETLDLLAWRGFSEPFLKEGKREAPSGDLRIISSKIQEIFENFLHQQGIHSQDENISEITWRGDKILVSFEASKTKQEFKWVIGSEGSHKTLQRALNLPPGTLRGGPIFFLGEGSGDVNQALQDAFNLVWKLARVMQKKSPERLLETYEEERVRARMAENGMARLKKRFFLQKFFSFVRPYPQAGDRVPQGFVLNARGHRVALWDLLSRTGFSCVVFSQTPQNLGLPQEIQVVCISDQKYPYSFIDTYQDSTKEVYRAWGTQGESLFLVRPDGCVAYRGSLKSLEAVHKQLQEFLL